MRPIVTWEEAIIKEKSKKKIISKNNGFRTKLFGRDLT